MPSTRTDPDSSAEANALFIGAVVLAVGYKLLLAWVDRESAEPVDDSDSLTN